MPGEDPRDLEEQRGFWYTMSGAIQETNMLE